MDLLGILKSYSDLHGDLFVYRKRSFRTFFSWSDHAARLPNDRAFSTSPRSSKFSIQFKMEFTSSGVSAYLVQMFKCVCVVEPSWRYQLTRFVFR